MACHAQLQGVLNPGIKPVSPMSAALAGGFFTTVTSVTFLAFLSSFTVCFVGTSFPTPDVRPSVGLVLIASVR